MTITHPFASPGFQSYPAFQTALTPYVYPNDLAALSITINGVEVKQYLDLEFDEPFGQVFEQCPRLLIRDVVTIISFIDENRLADFGFHVQRPDGESVPLGVDQMRVLRDNRTGNKMFGRLVFRVRAAAFCFTFGGDPRQKDALIVAVIDLHRADRLCPVGIGHSVFDENEGFSH